MLKKEFPVFCAKWIIQVITDIVCMHFLFSGINISITVDNYIFRGLFTKDFRIDVRDMFMQHNRHIHRAFPGVSLGVFEAI